MATSQMQRIVPKRIRDYVFWKHVGAVLFGCGLVWSGWLVFVLTGFDLLNFEYVDQRQVGSHPALWIAIVGSIGGAIYSRVAVKRELFLAEYGILSEAEVTHIGGVSAHDLTRMDYSYWVEGEVFSRAETVGKSQARELQVGSRIEILYDPRKPDRAAIYSDVFPNGCSEEDDTEA